MKRMARANSSFNGSDDEEKQDRISSLPDALLILILSFLDTKLAVQCSVLSKRWLILPTLLPVLNFDFSLFKNKQYSSLNKDFYKLVFGNFVNKVLSSHKRSIKIDRVNIKTDDYQILERVFTYAKLLGIPDLIIDTSANLSGYIPINSIYRGDFLVSLSLKGMLTFGKYVNFKGLVSLRLDRVNLVDIEPFSCFRKLDKLFLVNCKLLTGLDVLKVIALRLSSLTISSCFFLPIPYKNLVLLAPKLVLLQLDGLIPMSFKAYELPILDTVYIDFYFSDKHDSDQQKLNLLNIFRRLRNAKRVHLSPSTIELLNVCREMLAEEPSPFWKLEYVNLIPPPNKPSFHVFESVITYLIKDCPQAVVYTAYR